MLVRVIIQGKVYVLAASQVVILNDQQQPVGLAYQDKNVIVQSDAADADFPQMLSDLRIGLSAPQVSKVGG